MKTITLKADTAFDAVLCELAKQRHTSKSAIIREAVVHYRDWLARDRLRQNLLKASLKTRTQHDSLMWSMEQASEDGL